MTLSRKRRVSYVLLFLFLVVAGAELSLRAAGAAYFYFQTRENTAHANDASEMRILCIGESTTALGMGDSYPSQLRNLLHLRYPDRKISVANEGVSATTTTKILERLPSLLAKYKPQIVIFMMGVNDFRMDRPGVGGPAAWKWLAREVGELRVVKLVKYAALNAAAWEKSSRVPPPPPAPPAPRFPVWHSFADKQAQGDYERGKAAFEQRDFPASISLLERALGRDRNAPPELFEMLGKSYLHAGNHREAERNFDRYVAADPNFSSAKSVGFTYFFEYGESTEIGTSGALKFMKIADQRMPGDIEVEWILGSIYSRDKKTWKLAQKYLSDGVQRHTELANMYNSLAKIYIDQGRLAEAEETYLLATRYSNNNMTYQSWRGLIQLYSSENRKQEASRLAGEAMERMPNNREIQLEAAKVDEAYKSLVDYTNDYMELDSTRENFHRALQLVKSSGARSVVMQYPALEVAPLKRELAGEEGVVFVSNWENFKRASQTRKWDDLFTDHFTAAFGHFTAFSAGLVAKAAFEGVLATGALQ